MPTKDTDTIRKKNFQCSFVIGNIKEETIHPLRWSAVNSLGKITSQHNHFVSFLERCWNRLLVCGVRSCQVSSTCGFRCCSQAEAEVEVEVPLQPMGKAPRQKREHRQSNNKSHLPRKRSQRIVMQQRREARRLQPLQKGPRHVAEQPLLPCAIVCWCWGARTLWIVSSLVCQSTQSAPRLPPCPTQQAAKRAVLRPMRRARSTHKS